MDELKRTLHFYAGEWILKLTAPWIPTSQQTDEHLDAIRDLGVAEMFAANKAFWQRFIDLAPDSRGPKHG